MNPGLPSTETENPHHADTSKEKTISHWVNEHADELYSWTCNRVRNDALAEDLVQETFIAALQHYDSFQGKSQPKTWLFSILRNKITDHYRRSAKDAVTIAGRDERRAMYVTENLFDGKGEWLENEAHFAWSSETELLDEPGFASTMDECLHKLPASWCSIVQAKYLLEKNVEEVCQELGLSASNYWQVLHRSRLALKKCLEISWFSK